MTADGRPTSPASLILVGLPSVVPLALRIASAALVRSGNQPPFLLSERRIEVEHEGIGVAAEFSDNERHPLCHQPCHKCHITRQAVRLRDQDATLPCFCGSKRGCQLWPAIERIRAFAGLGLHEFSDDGELFGFGEALDRCALRLDPETRALLLP